MRGSEQRANQSAGRPHATRATAAGVVDEELITDTHAVLLWLRKRVHVSPMDSQSAFAADTLARLLAQLSGHTA